MKKCPKCSRVYADESLNFCLDDGEALTGADLDSEMLTAIQLPELSTGALIIDPKSTSPTAILPTTELNRVAQKHSLTRYWFAAGGVVLLAFAGYFGYRYYFAHSNLPITSIAVLPFKNRGGEADTQYLSEGLAESLIYRLSQLPDLKVSPTSSVFRYEDKDVDPVAVGNELGVNAVVSGRIVPHGDSITISADLVDIRDNRLIWGEQYDRKMSELLDTQREIAREIVENLKLKVSPQEKGLSKHYTESNEAYQLYLKGRFYWNKRESDSMHKSIQFYQQAIEVDPNFALAYSGLADTYNLISVPEAGGGDESPNDVLSKAKTAALKALQIDDSLAEAHVSLAHPLYYYDRDFVGAEREFKRAIELNPNYAVAHHWYAVFLTVVGRQPEALTEIKRAQELDPLSLSINVWVGWILALNGQLDKAYDQLIKTKEMDPNFPLTLHRLALLYTEKNMYDEAISEANNLLRGSASKLGTITLAYAYAKAGMRAKAQDQLDKLIASSKKGFVSSGSIAMVYAQLGDKDTAFKWLEIANDEHDMIVLRIKHDPRFASLRGDPRLDALVKRIGIPE
jgi:TolB-like protein/Tfp pilus assembly protein PilF